MIHLTHPINGKRLRLVHLSTKAPNGDSKVFYQQVKAEYYRYVAKSIAKTFEAACAAAQNIAMKEYAVTHPSLSGPILDYDLALIMQLLRDNLTTCLTLSYGAAF